MPTSLLDSLDSLIEEYRSRIKRTTLFDILQEEKEQLEKKSSSKKEKEPDNESGENLEDILNNGAQEEENFSSKEVNPEIELPDTGEEEVSKENPLEPSEKETIESPEESENSILGQLKNEKEFLDLIKTSMTLLYRKIEEDLIKDIRLQNTPDKLDDFYQTVGTLPDGENVSKEEWENIGKKLKQWLRLNLKDEYFVPSI